MRTLAEVDQLFHPTPEKGLSSEDVRKSQSQFGSNRLTPLPKEPIWKKFLEKFDDAIIKILLAAALLSMIVDLFKASPTLGGIGLGLVVILIVGAFVARFQEWIPTIMFGSAIILFFTGLVTGHFLVEGMAVMVAVILATGVAFISEYRSDREFEILNAQKEAIQVKVIRDGEFRTIAMDDVVVGDVVSLEMGDEIPADGRLLKANELYIDQSLMTGESEPVRKQVRPLDDDASGPEQPGCLYRGTQVVDGIGVLCVTEVGDTSYLGQIARKLSAEEAEAEDSGDETEEKRIKHKLTISKEMTPLQVKLQNLAELISKVGYIAAVAIFVAQLIYGVASGKVFFPQSGEAFLNVLGVLLGYFVNMVIIIVVAVPEGLPMSVTISLALAMRKMTRANSLVRQLVACETIGSATVICSDKTGTLTQNKMRVERLIWEGKSYDRGTEGWAVPGSGTWPRDGKPLDWLTLISAANSTANLEEKDGKIHTVGNTTEGALLQFIQEGGVKYKELRKEYEPLYQLHFSSERKRMTTVIKYGDRLVSLVKGAPEWLLEHTTHYQLADGSTQPWNEEAKNAVLECLRDSTVHAMRTLAFGYKNLPEDTPHEEDALHEIRDSLESELVFAGMVAIRDPLREDVKDAIEQCRSAGIEVKMITGDNVQTARAIGYNIGLITQAEAEINGNDGIILTSDKFNELSDEEIKELLPRLRILARARPLDKYRMVKLLQELDEVVAVTGDGTNDAPALKKADVGLAMGIAGTEVSKEASKIVLLDDAFSTIVKAVHWGRSLYENIQRFIQFQLTINVSALTIFFLGTLLFQVEAPFTVLQLLWINVIMDTFAAIALCSEPPRPGVMMVPPKRKDENILSPGMIRTILSTGAFFVVVMLVLLMGMKVRGVENNQIIPGWFGTAQPETNWSVESSGSRFSLPQKDLDVETNAEGEIVAWKIEEEPEVAPESDGGKEVDVAFTVYQVSIFFSVYVFFQVWNQINCRSLTPRESGFSHILENPAFLSIASIIAIGQILIVTFGGAVFNVEPIGITSWLVIAATTASVLVFAEAARFIWWQMEKKGSAE